MQWVVEKGTGTAVALPTYPIAGKTGTAYKFMNGHYSRYNYVSSFVGFRPGGKSQVRHLLLPGRPARPLLGRLHSGTRVFKEVAKRALAYAMVPGVTPDSAIAMDDDKAGDAFLYRV